MQPELPQCNLASAVWVRGYWFLLLEITLTYWKLSRLPEGPLYTIGCTPIRIYRLMITCIRLGGRHGDIL